jgi:hypothetical protein
MRTHKEVDVVYFKVLSHYSPEETEEDHGTSQE